MEVRFLPPPQRMVAYAHRAPGALVRHQAPPFPASVKVARAVVTRQVGVRVLGWERDPEGAGVSLAISVSSGGGAGKPPSAASEPLDDGRLCHVGVLIEGGKMKFAKLVRAAVTQKLADNYEANQRSHRPVTFTVNEVVDEYGLDKRRDAFGHYYGRGVQYPVSIAAQMVRNELHERWAVGEVERAEEKRGRFVQWLNPTGLRASTYKGMTLTKAPTHFTSDKKRFR